MKSFRRIFTRKHAETPPPQEVQPAPPPDPEIERVIERTTPALKREVVLVARQSRQIREALMNGALLHVYGEKK